MDLSHLFNERNMRRKPVAPPPPPTGLSRSDLLVLRIAANLAKKPGTVVKKTEIIRKAVEAWHAANLGTLIGLTGDDIDRNAKAFVVEALGRLIELRLLYDAHPRSERCASPDAPAKAVTLGQRGLTIGAAISAVGELEGDRQKLNAVRHRIATAIRDAEGFWAKANPSAAQQLRARRVKSGGDGRRAPANLAAVVIERPKSPMAERMTISSFLQRVDENEAYLARLDKLLNCDPSVTVNGGKKSDPIAAPEQRADSEAGANAVNTGISPQ